MMFDEEGFREVVENHAAVFLTVKVESEIASSKVFNGGLEFSSETQYEVVHAVADGRIAALKIHEMIMNY